MNPDQLLSQLANTQLKDIQPPPPPGWWPPAIGWWILAALLLLLTGYLVLITIRYYRKNAWRRAAIANFRQLREQYEHNPDTQNLTALVALLKRCTRSLEPGSFTGAETGSQWQHYLSTPAGILDPETCFILNEGHYQANCPKLEKQALDQIEKWIRRQKS